MLTSRYQCVLTHSGASPGDGGGTVSLPRPPRGCTQLLIFSRQSPASLQTPCLHMQLPPLPNVLPVYLRGKLFISVASPPDDERRAHPFL